MEPARNCAPVHPQTFGQRLKAARDHADLTQRQFAEKLGCAEFSVSRWENDHTSPTLDNAHRMADVCGVSRAWLTDGVGGMAAEPGADSAA